jgi:hypothetical protein
MVTRSFTNKHSAYIILLKNDFISVKINVSSLLDTSLTIIISLYIYLNLIRTLKNFLSISVIM